MGKVNKWKLNRAGILNFWYYDEEFFDFANGKLLLRGSNGSGKSVTMQSLLPVLLDGRKSPDRLDPFGSKARRMEDYLLGEKEIVDSDERTGYLFLEYKREDTNQYLTTGIGLQAKRHKTMNFWGFVITDNRRIGEDFLLYEQERQGGEMQKIPLSRIQLENRIEDGGHVVKTSKEYMNLVNKYVFGFETNEAYEDLIKLLIQLRSPKLSKDFKPTVIYEILEGALPPLSDEDLRHLSDTIEHMDQTKQQIEQLHRELESLGRLNKAYQTYNERHIAEQAEEWLKTYRKAEREQNTYEELQSTKTALEQEIRLLEEEKLDLEQQKDTFEKKEQRLRSHEVWDLEKNREEVERSLKQKKIKFQGVEEKLHKRKQRELKLKEELDQEALHIDQKLADIQDQLSELRHDAEVASFLEHEQNEHDYKRYQEGEFDFQVWEKEARAHATLLEEIEERFEKYDVLRDQYSMKSKDLGEQKRKRDKAEREEKDWARMFEEDKEKKLNEIHTWTEEHDYLDISPELMNETARAVHHLYEPMSYTELSKPFQDAQMNFEQNKRTEMSEHQHELKMVENEIQKKQVELQEWKNQKDPEPERHPSTNEARQALIEQGVAFVPFYGAVEFREHVSQEVRNRLEAALLETGVLDALITDQSSVQHDRILKSDPQMMAHTLADYLVSDVEEDAHVSSSHVEEVLQSILVEDGSSGGHFTLKEDGEYRVGLLEGHAAPVESVRFIGKVARKRHREEQIARLTQEIAELEEQRSEIRLTLQRLEAAIQTSRNALASFPSDGDLVEAYRSLENKRWKIGRYTTTIEELDHQIKRIYEEFQQIKQDIGERTRHLNIEETRDGFKQAKQQMQRHYVLGIAELKSMHQDYQNTLKRKSDLAFQLEEVEEEVLDLLGEVNDIQDDLDRAQLDLSQILEQLDQAGAQDIRQQIQEVRVELNRIDKELNQKQETLPAKKTDLNHNMNEMEKQSDKVQFWNYLQQAWQYTFEQECSRKFVAVPEEESLLQQAKNVKKQFGHRLKEKEAQQVATHLTNVFYNEQPNLMEYRMKNFERSQEVPSWMQQIENDDYQASLDQWKQKASRKFIEMDYLGKQVSPYYVQQEVEHDQMRQESLLDQQDKDLYEEILFKSVGNKLRSRIQRAEKWTSQMNKLMESRDTSSGLTFSIKWKPRTADTEEEMDTKDLVALLKRDARTLKEEDLQQIITHFRSKIEKAKEMIDMKGEGHTLLQVLKEVLDYRKWFSFVLSYRREGEPKRELTNHAFYQFSGGEKAMAMYIPLFTACYSRYKEADPHAPFIISLDEAFAGVDDNNIREMFEVLEHLGFDYIMNSQVLWGDYDTISELAISELVRPKNANYVTLINYLWDGNQLGMSGLVEDEVEDEEDETLV